jgi:Domain of unknown function (DUF397)
MAIDPKSSEQRWQRPTICASSSCVEVATIGDTIAIRDSKDPESPVLTYDRDEWQAFVAGVKAGEFDLQ